MDINLFQATVLGLIQGLTEFLPISSSAHLQIPRILFDWSDQGLTFDVALHFGSLVAVLVYFRDDIVELIKAGFARVAYKKKSSYADLFILLIIATLPAVLFGFLFNEITEKYARSTEVVAIFTLVFALVLFYADRKGSLGRLLKEMTWKDAFYIGMAQSIALIPGTSRSGITMTAALLLGYDRKSAAKFSFLMSIPVIFGGSLLRSTDLIGSSLIELNVPILFYGALVSGTVAYLCISFFLALIERIGFFPFVLYRVLMAVILLSVSLN